MNLNHTILILDRKHAGYLSRASQESPYLSTPPMVGCTLHKTPHLYKPVIPKEKQSLEDKKLRGRSEMCPLRHDAS